jgi:outer membrane protein
MIRLTILFFWLLLALSSFSQENWTLEKCIDHALKNNLNIKESQLDVDLSKASLNKTTFNYLPTLNGNASHGYNWGQQIDPFTNTFATEQVRSNNFYLSSSVTLFSGLQNYHTKQQAKTDYKTQQYNIEIQQRNLKIDVTAAYLQVVLNQEILSTFQEQLKLTTQQKERTELLIEANRKTNSELLEVEAQLSLNELNVTKAENDIKTTRLLLKQLINLPKETDIQIEKAEIVESSEQQTELDYTSLVEIEQAKERLNSSFKSLQIAQGGIYPRLSLNASVGSGFSGNNKELNTNGEYVPKAFTTQFDENLYQSVTLSLSIPILDRHTTIFNIQRAKIEVEKAKINQDKTSQDLENKIEQLKIDVDNTKSELISSKKALKFAQLSAENARLKYENGVLNFTAYNEVSIKLFIAQSNLIQSKFKHHFKNKLMLIYSKN